MVTASGLAPGRGKMGVDQQVNRLTYAVKGKLRSAAEQLGYDLPAQDYFKATVCVVVKPAVSDRGRATLVTMLRETAHASECSMIAPVPHI